MKLKLLTNMSRLDFNKITMLRSQFECLLVSYRDVVLSSYISVVLVGEIILDVLSAQQEVVQIESYTMVLVS